MPVATPDDVRLVDYGEHLRAFPDERIECVLSLEVAQLIDPVDWGARTLLAESLVAGHLLLVSAGSSSGLLGRLVSETEDGRTRTYAAPPSSVDSDFWSLTQFGQRFYQLRLQHQSG